MALPEVYSVEIVLDTPLKAKLTITAPKEGATEAQHQMVLTAGSVACRDMAQKLLKAAEILEAHHG